MDRGRDVDGWVEAAVVRPLPPTAAAVLRRLWAVERTLDRFNLTQVGATVRWDGWAYRYRPLGEDPDHRLLAAIGNALVAEVLALQAAARRGAARATPGGPSCRVPWSAS